MPRQAAISEDVETDSAPHGLLERTLGVLELLAANARGLQLYEIAETLAIPRSATHRVLTSLIERGYVRQERRQGAYQLTARIASLAFTFLAGSGVTDFAQPILDRLAAESSELVRLAMVDGRELVWVAKAQGSQFGLRYDPDMGQIGRLSCSASGHAWLSCLPEDQAVALVEKQGFGLRRDYGPKAPESKSALLKYLRTARKLGVAITTQTFTPWMAAIAAPVRDPQNGDVVGAVVVAGPHVRLTEEKMLELAPSLIGAAQELALAIVASPGLSPRSGGAANIFVTPAK
ncbi:MAG: IclR family transcriptional regulator [Hyphomicrobiales bacterium]|nr:IclR family transcriptional regulator [Hyphomicrobiales bacterium]